MLLPGNGDGGAKIWWSFDGFGAGVAFCPIMTQVAVQYSQGKGVDVFGIDAMFRSSLVGGR